MKKTLQQKLTDEIAQRAAILQKEGHPVGGIMQDVRAINIALVEGGNNAAA